MPKLKDIPKVDRPREKFLEIKNPAQISTEDLIAIILGHGSKEKGVFIFLDPPYYSTTQSRLYGKKGYLHVDFNHEVFIRNLKQCKHKWLMTYDNNDYIRGLFRDFYQVEWELQYGMNNYKQKTAQKGRELLIANYEMEKLR